MKICSRHSFRVPKDFGTRLADPNKCGHIKGLLHYGKIYHSSFYKDRLKWYDNATPEARLKHQVKLDNNYQPL